MKTTSYIRRKLSSCEGSSLALAMFLFIIVAFIGVTMLTLMLSTVQSAQNAYKYAETKTSEPASSGSTGTNKITADVPTSTVYRYLFDQFLSEVKADKNNYGYWSVFDPNTNTYYSCGYAGTVNSDGSLHINKSNYYQKIVSIMATAVFKEKTSVTKTFNLVMPSKVNFSKKVNVSDLIAIGCWDLPDHFLVTITMDTDYSMTVSISGYDSVGNVVSKYPLVRKIKALLIVHNQYWKQVLWMEDES